MAHPTKFDGGKKGTTAANNWVESVERYLRSEPTTSLMTPPVSCGQQHSSREGQPTGSLLTGRPGPNLREKSKRAIQNLKQEGAYSDLLDYVTAFNQHAAHVRWDQQALIAAFRRGLKELFSKRPLPTVKPTRANTSCIANALDKAREQLNKQEPRKSIRRPPPRPTPAVANSSHQSSITGGTPCQRTASRRNSAYTAEKPATSTTNDLKNNTTAAGATTTQPEEDDEYLKAFDNSKNSNHQHNPQVSWSKDEPERLSFNLRYCLRCCLTTPANVVGVNPRTKKPYNLSNLEYLQQLPPAVLNSVIVEWIDDHDAQPIEANASESISARIAHSKKDILKPVEEIVPRELDDDLNSFSEKEAGHLPPH
ncbi:hypothetical protein M407DRAFT_33302 [Tulasnella calospora MUT 4182]|uniref:Uncharacterized protein n=1 Tax=Tulasnella calospora MUT 4182 TaxID=1051891 RepID=A0A0C3PR07_9AGAM|nr:hypothetical protein M407DRAFT_33302 [Tulasnella calospora MUT 4182]